MKQTDEEELAYVRSLLVLAREFGATNIVCGNFSIALGPPPPPAPIMVDRDVVTALSEEEKAIAEERAAEDAHYAKWRRITRSSGAPIPTYVPPSKGAV